METKPCVLVVSSSNTKPTSLIKLITKEAPENLVENVSHTWKIETKYYKADVDLIGITEDFTRTDDFNQSVEALIIHMDTNNQNGLDDLKDWASVLEDCEPEVKLLICNYCDNGTKISKPKATEWCLKNGFEFIELYPTSIEQSDQDIITEKFGVDRIIESLHANMWSNMVMNDDGYDTGLVHKDNSAHEEGTDDFTDLFDKLHMMKGSLQNVPMRERRQYAEQMVTAFWNAIGGDEEEIADI